jgi:cytochrome c
MINQCIEGPLAGKAIDNDSQEMKDLISYIRTLGK